MLPTQKKSNAARLWRPSGLEELMLFKASFTTYAYDRHTHDEYALGVIEQGPQRFFHRKGMQTAPPGAIISLNPDEVHDGVSKSEKGYRYRMAYLSQDFLAEAFQELFPKFELRAFLEPVTLESEISPRLLSALRWLEVDPQAAQPALLDVVFDLFQRHARPRVESPRLDAAQSRVNLAVERLRDCPDCPQSPPRLEELAREAGLSKFHFLRVFKAHTGMTPHAYLMQRRVCLARKALEEGAAPAEAAFVAGFTDQSHLTRRFKAIYGLTPGAFQSAQRLKAI